MVAAPVTGFWQNPTFATFRPYIRTSQDLRVGQHRRCELDPKAPVEIVARALVWQAPCSACGAPMNPFRARRAPSLRGNATGAVYLGTTCRQVDSAGCSRSSAAAMALEALEHTLTQPYIEPTQTNWLDAFGVEPAPPRMWH